MAPERARSRRTRGELVAATVACLVERGYGQLSTRAVAERAGLPVSQIHYHFGGKEGLLLAVLDQQNAQLLDRQRAMYGTQLPLWKRWAQACDYLEEDLASGYVRVLQELIAVGWSDTAVADEVGRQLRGWVQLLTEVADEAAEVLRFDALTPQHVATLVGCLFLGAEEVELLGLGAPLQAIDALRALGELLRRVEEGS
ncbi:TetR/AcrR family transcriptional regulator [Egicoccus sp. AB-alg2]|uniref:TetR/AcrR family transcriptional regulator n=1 Tax=Egicoccus sp. AB-alg2 TaxID=3242693 RepID=UPI00359ED51C